MRTTLDLDDAVLAVARARARARGVSLGRAVSDLALERLAATARTSAPGKTGVFPVLTGPAGHPITDQMVADALEED